MILLKAEIIVTIISLGLSLGSLIILLMQKASEEQKMATTFAFFSLISCLGYLGILISGGNLAMLIFSTKIKYVGSFSLYMVFPLLLRYFKLKQWNIPCAIMTSLIILVALLVLTFDIPGIFSSNWFFKDFYPEIRKGLPYLHKEYGWGHHLYVGLAALYSVSITGIFFFTPKKPRYMDLKNLIILYLILISPALFYLVEKVFRFIMGVELVPIVPVAISISNLMFVHLIAVRKFCDVNALANNALFDLINSPAIVIDNAMVITNINSYAATNLKDVSRRMIGKEAYSALPMNIGSALKKLIIQENTRQEAVALLDTDKYLIVSNSKTYQPKLRRISRGTETQGYVMWMEDITLMKKYSQQLENEVDKKTAEIQENEKKLELHANMLKQLRDQMIIGFSTLAEHHDLTTEGHLMRTSFYVEAIALELRKNSSYSRQLTADFISNLTHVAPLHDIGKIYISEEICNKPSKLETFEFEKMKEHTVKGAEFIEQNLKQNVDPMYYQMTYNVVKYHHEWWNGDGYPCGLKGEEIPLCARIMAVADVYDALRTARPYKKELDSETSFSIIQEQKGSHFDPVIVDAFVSIKDEIDAIFKRIVI